MPIDGTPGNDVLNGTAGDDTINGLAGNDTLNGLAGNDMLDGGAGIDTMSGGAGNDTYVVDNANDKVIEAAGAGFDYILSSVSYTLSLNVEGIVLLGTANLNAVGNAQENQIQGNAGDNILLGGGGTDYLWGGLGHDRLDGGTGFDYMEGGRGDDTYIVDSTFSEATPSDLVRELENEGIDIIYSTASNFLPDHVENLVLQGSAMIGSGNGLANTIIGTDGLNQLFGENGDDIIKGMGGVDIIDGGSGADAMNGGSGDDTYYVDDAGDTVIEAANSGHDTVNTEIDFILPTHVEDLIFDDGAGPVIGYGNALANTILGNDFNNKLFGLAGNDTLNGFEGNDELEGGTGADRLIGGRGDDIFIVDSAADEVVELADQGFDWILTTASIVIPLHVEVVDIVAAGRTVTGNAQVNHINGYAGNEVLKGMAGDDTLYGYAGNDVLDGGTGKDWLQGGVGDDMYFVDTVLDTDGDMTQTGDIVAEGADSGTDTIQSTVSQGVLSNNVENLVLLGTANLLAGGNALANTLVGNAGANYLSGGDGNDILKGNAGNDTLVGGTGADTMAGNAGNDIFVVDNAGDTVLEGAGQGTDLVRASISYVLPANVENLLLFDFGGAINGQGNSLSNTITGNASTNVLVGGAGNDALIGGGGSDLLAGDDGADALNGGTGFDMMSGGAGNDIYTVDSVLDLNGNGILEGDQVFENVNDGIDTVQTVVSQYAMHAYVENVILIGAANIDAVGNALANVMTGNAGVNALLGFDGDDILKGMDGNDALDGGLGADILNGGAGADAMSGRGGNDTYIVDNAGDVVSELADDGIDTVQAAVTVTLGDNVENLTQLGTASINGVGNALANKLAGNNGNNALAGQAGNDTLSGAGGNDTLYGGLGQDFLTGGPGADIFVFRTLADSGFGAMLRDVITDFDATDRIDLSVIDANAGVAGNQAFAFIGAGAFTAAGQVRAIATGGTTYVTGDVNGDGAADFQIALVGTHTLNAGDFLL